MHILSNILTILFPDRCVGCKLTGVLLCDACISRLTPANPTGDPTIISVFSYRDPRVRSLVRRLKYSNARHAADFLGRAMAEALSELLGEDQVFWGSGNVLLVPIPLSRSRRTQRGYNQSELLARSVAAHMRSDAVMVSLNILSKVRDTIPQARMRSRRDRLDNLRDCFFATAGNPLDTIVLVDDVYTTGSTITAAREALFAAGYRKLYVLTAAH